MSQGNISSKRRFQRTTLSSASSSMKPLTIASSA